MRGEEYRAVEWKRREEGEDRRSEGDESKRRSRGEREKRREKD